MTVGSASKKAKRTAKRWRAVHRGNRIGRAERDAVTNHLGLCLQVAFTAQSEAREAYERSVGDADGEVGGEANWGGLEGEPAKFRGEGAKNWGSPGQVWIVGPLIWMANKSTAEA